MLKSRALAVVVGFILLAGCTGGTGSPSPAAAGASPAAAGGGQQITLTYWGYREGMVAPTGKTAAQAIADFEKSHPNVKVNTVAMETSDFDLKLPTAFDTPGGPDIVYIGSEPNHLGRYVQANQVLNLDPYLKQYGWDKLLPAVAARTTYNGHQYGIGWELETLGLMYNTKLFDKYGWQPPTTLEDLEALMAKMKQQAPNLVPLTLAQGAPGNGIHMMHALGYATIPTKEILATVPFGSGNYTDPGWLQMLQIFQRWAQAGYFPKGANGVGWENHWADFCAGKDAMLAQGTWLFSTIADCEKANPNGFGFGFVPFPVAKGMPFQAYTGTGKAWRFPERLAKEPTKLQAALELVAAMTTAPGVALSWVNQDQLFPGVPFDRSKANLTPQQQTALKIFDTAGSNGGAVDIGFNNSSAETDLWVKDMQGIFSGTTTPEQMIKDLQAELDKEKAAWKSGG